MLNNFIEKVNKAKIAKVRVEAPNFTANDIRIEQMELDSECDNVLRCYTFDGGVITIDTDSENCAPIICGHWTQYQFGQLQLLIA